MITKKALGAVLAGGRGRRMGGAKAQVRLGDRPLLARPVQALQTVCAQVVVVAKPATVVPEVGVAVLREPAAPVHPLVGVVEALRWAAGQELVVAAGDMPGVTEAALRALLAAPGPAAIACGPQSGPQPLLGVYRPEALAVLAPLAREGTAPMRAVARVLGATLVAVPEAVLVNVNTPEQLAAIRT